MRVVCAGRTAPSSWRACLVSVRVISLLPGNPSATSSKTGYIFINIWISLSFSYLQFSQFILVNFSLFTSTHPFCNVNKRKGGENPKDKPILIETWFSRNTTQNPVKVSLVQFGQNLHNNNKSRAVVLSTCLITKICIFQEKKHNAQNTFKYIEIHSR